MSVVITNVSDLAEDSEYTVRINNGPVIARFKHRRSEGLALCLARASYAVAGAVALSASADTDAAIEATRP